jgi:hypothetical protein
MSNFIQNNNKFYSLYSFISTLCLILCIIYKHSVIFYALIAIRCIFQSLIIDYKTNNNFNSFNFNIFKLIFFSILIYFIDITNICLKETNLQSSIYILLLISFDNNFVFVQNKNNNKYLSISLSLFMSWMSFAIYLLDWDESWQQWPYPTLFGYLIGSLFDLIIIFIN